MFYTVNRYTVSGDAEEFDRLLREVNRHMSAQPGFHVYRLYRSESEPKVYLETSQWETAEQHRAAMTQDGFWGPVKKIGEIAAVEPGSFQLVRENRAAEVRQP
ncbi:antibiotic biosynthesis monooxygenase [Amycolatopsis rubida]|uniref:Antibiotic biosynthesis monooxygenase n=1 Tax=Amycolatopsis rubida TaxID=112413 RepID=A0ABX0CDD6_9PSEU|nr:MULTISPECIES: antibiotic biosynthesis monooxygenase family protein [Amycolatopsis]MYW97965.1 antibiotic biosynthesis monooxygenase [Amycolatopsis rubida]NEC62950.1 antibiotic biosynthesis monooxygenase [Amycolatopsis rubida]OAP22618.1 Antibiotic biosynthesis monooxygenase [Amycolatopsis sp. M39]